jgi:serine/threonine protein kinase
MNDNEDVPTIPLEHPGQEAPDLLPVGERLLGRYEVLNAKIGSVGVVYLLRDLQTGRKLAAKTWLHLPAGQSSLIEQFRREVEFWIELEPHPNVVTAHFVEVHHGRPYLFMEYVSGGAHTSLRQRLKHVPPSEEEAIRYAYQFCLGMEFANRKHEIAHLDLKPENLLIGEKGLLKVTDFGLASRVSYAYAEIPRPAYGSWPYAAPERYLEEPEDARSDLYSFGVIFYEMLTNRLPYPGGLDWHSTYDEFKQFHQGGGWEEFVRALYYWGLPGVNFPSSGIILNGCLAHHVDDRFPDFISLRRAIEHTFGLILPADSVSPSQEKQDLHSQAMNYYHIGRYAKAQELMNRALQTEPMRAPLWLDAGRILLANGFDSEALDCLEQALSLDPTLDEARRLREHAIRR